MVDDVTTRDASLPEAHSPSFARVSLSVLMQHFMPQNYRDLSEYFSHTICHQDRL